MGVLPQAKQRVIIIGSNPATRLGLIRMVGEIGCAVTVINLISKQTKRPHRPYDVHSKYVDMYLCAEKFNDEGLYRVLVNNCQDERLKPLIFSVDDDSACLIDRIQERLSDKFFFSNIENTPGAIARLMDKQEQKRVASLIGFNVSRSWSVDIEEGKYMIPDGVLFPCYVKGRLSYRSAKRYQKRCDSICELEQLLSEIAINNPSPLIIEEYLDIQKEYGVIGYCDGKTVLVPAIVDLLEGGKGAHKGVSVYGRVRKFCFDDQIKSLIESFVKYIHLSGLFNIDIVESKGIMYFVEINFRFAAYGYAVFQAGVNLSAFQIYRSCLKDISVLNTSIYNECSYFNEYVALDDVLSGNRSWKNYFQLLNRSDCQLIYQNNDLIPFLSFIIHMIRSIIVAFLKGLIYRR